MRTRARLQAGQVSVATVVMVVLILGLAAVPFVLMMRSQVDSGKKATGALEQANEATARLDLTNAARAAQVYLAENGTLVGFQAAAPALEPGVTFNSSTVAVAGEVSIRAVTDAGLVLVTNSGSGALCAVVGYASVTYGHGDAASPAACAA